MTTPSDDIEIQITMRMPRSMRQAIARATGETSVASWIRAAIRARLLTL
jgi:hypothetical protein